jgi:hypothetical protein
MFFTGFQEAIGFHPLEEGLLGRSTILLDE